MTTISFTVNGEARDLEVDEAFIHTLVATGDHELASGEDVGERRRVEVGDRHTVDGELNRGHDR